MFRKYIICILLTILLLINSVAVKIVYADEQNTTVTFIANSNLYWINGQQMQMDTKAFIDDNSRLMVPIAFLANAFGISSSWNDNTKTVTLVDRDITILITVGNKTILVNNEKRVIDTSPINRDSRVFLPVRHIAEALKFTGTWNDIDNSAKFTRSENQVRPTIQTKFLPNQNGYSFANMSSSFGYPNNYKIPYQTFIDVLGKSGNTEFLYNHFSSWHGSCYGFTTTSLLFYQNKLAYNIYQTDISKVYDIKPPRTPDSNLTKLIEHYQVSQFIQAIYNTQDQNMNNLSGIIDAVQKFQDTNNNPVILSVFDPNEGGHAIVAYGVSQNGIGNYDLHIYDNNWPGEDRIIHINIPNRTWQYEIFPNDNWGSARGGNISYVPISIVAEETEKSKMNSTKVFLSVNTSNVEIKNSNNIKLPDISDAYEILPMGIRRDGDNYSKNIKVFSLPKDTYSVQSSEKITVSLSNESVYFDVSDLQSNSEFTSNLNAENSINVQSNEQFKIACNSIVELEKNKLVINGRSGNLIITGSNVNNTLSLTSNTNAYTFDKQENTYYISSTSENINLSIPTNLFSEITIENASGNLNLTNIKLNNLILINKSGNIKLTNIASDNLDINNKSGNITLSSITCQKGIIVNQSGNVIVSNTDRNNLSIQTTSGNVIYQ